MRFRYSSYWGTWNRLFPSCNGYTIELNLTPVNGFKWGQIEEVKSEKFRAHFTPTNLKDKVTNELPANVIAEMKEHLGDELTERLLNFNYFSEITAVDVIKAKSNGGGVPFEVIKKMKTGEVTYHHNT